MGNDFTRKAKLKIYIGRGAFCKEEARVKANVDKTEERMPE